MALKKETVEAIAKTLGLDATKITEALASDTDVEIPVPVGTFIPEAEMPDYEQRIKKPAYEEGKKAGVEMAVKTYKEKEGITIEGKSMDDFVTALKTKVLTDAKIPEVEKVKEAERKIELLRSELETATKTKDTEIQTLTNQLKDAKVSGMLLPAVPEGVKALKPTQFIALFRSEYTPDIAEDGSLVVKKGGQVVLDKLAKPVPIQQIMTEFAIANKWLDSDGRGGGNEPGAGTGKYKDETELMRDLRAKRATQEEIEVALTEFRKSKK